MRTLKWLRSFLVRFWFSVQMAGHGILSYPLRSALTILGVTIGVASVVSLMGIGEGARLSVMQQFKSLGENVIDIKALDPTVEFEPGEAEELIERVEGLDFATPVVHTDAIMKWRRARGNIDIIGVNQDFPEIRDHALLSGHFFTNLHVQQRSPVVVLGYKVGMGLLNGRDPVGNTIQLNGYNYRIIGVLSEKGEGQADGVDEKILIPYTAALKFTEKKTVEEIWAKAGSSEEADLAVVQLGRIYKRKLGLDQSAPTIVPSNSNEGGNVSEKETGEKVSTGAPAPVSEPKPGGSPNPNDDSFLSKGKDVITITSLNQMVEEADKANRVMTLLLGGIAAVSLLVGGLGIMNIMLVAVSERTKEIGVRRALGAKQIDLMIQFILEALYLSALGVIIGLVIGIWGLSLFADNGFQTAVSYDAIKVAILVALGSGLLFGAYPAFSASSVPPVEALRR